MSTISRICPRAFGRAQSLCRGFSNRNIPVHRHSARDHQRVDLVPWNDMFSPSSILPASFTSRFRDIEKMMRDMENVLEHKYLSFPARGEDSEVCECTPPSQIHICRDLFILTFKRCKIFYWAYLHLCHEMNVNMWLAVSRKYVLPLMRKNGVFLYSIRPIYKKVNDLGRPFSVGETKQVK